MTDSKTDQNLNSKSQDSDTSKASTAEQNLDSVNKPNRRILKPSRGSVKDVTVVPPVEALTSDAKAIIGRQLALMRSKSDKGITLDIKESRMLTSYLDSLVRLLKEEREAAKSEDLSSYTVEELFEALQPKKSGE